MLIKIRERVHSAMFHRYKTITFCVKREVQSIPSLYGECIELGNGHSPSMISFTMKCHFSSISTRIHASVVMGLCELKHFTVFPLLVI